MFTKSKKKSDESPTVRLMQAMRLGGKDLDHNRAGELSPIQRKRLRRGFVIRTVFHVGLILCAELNLVLLTLHIPGRPTPPAVWIVGMMTLALLIWGRLVVHNYRKRMAVAHVIALTGRVHIYGRGCLKLTINADQTERFYENVPGYRAFIEGETYSLYSPSFAPIRIIAAEHVPAESIQE